MKQIIQFISLLLPFLKKKSSQEIIDFSDLVKGQYTYLRDVIEKSQTDYFELSGLVKEMNKEIITLNRQLQEALSLQCKEKICPNRVQ